ncbi:MAG: hypothetical protein JWO04_1302 [Gammaproteobacteria bacterium]|nr:hypothetical protein [Gammaproteobacteria bacterium]
MGFANPTAEVTFPLSSTKLLLMTHRNVEYRGVLSRDVVDFANQARAANSDQFLFASVNDPRIEQLAQEFRNTRPAMTTRGFGPKEFGKISIRSRRPRN